MFIFYVSNLTALPLLRYITVSVSTHGNFIKARCFFFYTATLCMWVNLIKAALSFTENSLTQLGDKNELHYRLHHCNL